MLPASVAALIALVATAAIIVGLDNRTSTSAADGSAERISSLQDTTTPR